MRAIIVVLLRLGSAHAQIDGGIAAAAASLSPQQLQDATESVAANLSPQQQQDAIESATEIAAGLGALAAADSDPDGTKGAHYERMFSSLGQFEKCTSEAAKKCLDDCVGSSPDQLNCIRGIKSENLDFVRADRRRMDICIDKGKAVEIARAGVKAGVCRHVHRHAY